MPDLRASLDALRRTMASFTRPDGEGLAVAVGVPEVVQRVAGCLSAEALRRHCHGPNGYPDVVWHRVEALAAWSPRRLGEVAARWIPPHELPRCTGLEHDWWMAAWWSALRHLDGLGLADRASAGVPELRHEAEILWPEAAGPVTWAETRAAAVGPMAYRIIRIAAQAELADRWVSAEDLERGPLPLLRLLRGRFERLGPDARAWIDAQVPDALAREGVGPALLVEAARALALPGLAALVPALTERLAADPAAWWSVAYTLVTDWRVP